jgi:hypothetical protein
MLVKKPELYASCATNIIRIYINHPQRHRDDLHKDYDSLATAHAFLRDAATETILTNTVLRRSLTRYPAYVSSDADILRCFLTSCIFRRHQAGFGTEHLKNDIRECCYPGKRTRPDTTRQKPIFRRTYQRAKAVSVPQTFYFLHPAASAFSRFFR